MRKTGAIGGAAAIAAMSWWGCRAPTEITITVTATRPLLCAQLKGVLISVADKSSGAEANVGSPVTVVRACDEATNSFGTLVITPGGGDTAAILVVAGVSAEATTCNAGNHYAGCIVVRRSLAFIDHKALTVPVELEASCADVPCDVITTCRSGTCISSDYDCADGNTCRPSDARVQADGGVLPDGAVVLPDGAVILPDGGPATDGGNADAGTDASAEAGTDGSIPMLTGCNQTCTVDGMTGAACLGQPADVCCYTDTTQNCASQQMCAQKNSGNHPIAACCSATDQCSGKRCCLHTNQNEGYAQCEPSCASGAELCSLFGVPCAAAGTSCKQYKGTSLYACQ